MADTNAQTEENVTQTPQKKKKGKLLVFIIAGVGCVLVLVALLCLGLYFLLKDSEDTDEDTNSPPAVIEDVDEEEDADDDSEDQDNEDDTQDTEDATVPYEGETITADVLIGWKIEELYDGEGSIMLPEGIYDGLTGVVVVNSNGDEVFRIDAVSGIGGMDICQTIYKFTDTEESYVTDYFNTTKDFNQSVTPPEPDPTIVDLSSKDYTEFTLFNVEVRRVGKVLYFNMSETDGVFNPACGMFESIQTFQGLSYSYQYSDMVDTLDSYVVSLSDTVKNDELPVLDDILDSMQLKGS